jgi:hypothetical protein
MSSWGNNDNAANTPLWAAMQVKKSPDSANQTAFFDNTTPDAFIPGETIGLFGVDAQEAVVNHGVHTGWVIRTVGSGGRAGRVQEEVLVAMNTIILDSDGQVYPNVSITLSGPSNGSNTAGAANANVVIFAVSPTLKGNTAATLSYQWQVNNGVGAWVNMSDGNNPQPGGVQKSGVTTNTLTLKPWDTTANGFVFRCIVTAADEGVSVTSSNAYITIY